MKKVMLITFFILFLGSVSAYIQGPTVYSIITYPNANLTNVCMSNQSNTFNYSTYFTGSLVCFDANSTCFNSTNNVWKSSDVWNISGNITIQNGTAYNFSSIYLYENGIDLGLRESSDNTSQATQISQRLANGTNANLLTLNITSKNQIDFQNTSINYLYWDVSGLTCLGYYNFSLPDNYSTFEIQGSICNLASSTSPTGVSMRFNDDSASHYQWSLAGATTNTSISDTRVQITPAMTDVSQTLCFNVFIPINNFKMDDVYSQSGSPTFVSSASFVPRNNTLGGFTSGYFYYFNSTPIYKVQFAPMFGSITSIHLYVTSKK